MKGEPDQEKKLRWWSTLIAVTGPVLLILFLWGLATKFWTDPYAFQRPVRGWLWPFSQAERLRDKGDLYGASNYYAIMQ